MLPPEPIVHLGPVGVLRPPGDHRPVNAYVYRVFSRASAHRSAVQTMGCGGICTSRLWGVKVWLFASAVLGKKV